MSSSGKRKRLNYACDRCRNRKTRCDDRQPECSNCFKAKARCTTKDLRNPTVPVIRHEAQLSLDSAPHTAHISSYGADANASVSGMTSSAISQYNINRDTATEREDRNDVQSPGQGAAAARLPAFPRFINGNSLYILAQWLDLAFARLNHPFRLAHMCQESKVSHGRATRAHTNSPSTVPNAVQRDTMLQHFLRNVHQVFPLFPADYWKVLMMSHAHDEPIRIILQTLVMAMYRNSDSRNILNEAFSQLSVLIQSTSLEGIVALIYMAIAFRGYDDSETARHVLSLTSSIALTMGLHRASHSQTIDHVRAWWTLYVLDKALAVELERPAIIKTQDCNQIEVEQGSILSAIIELARIQEVVIERMFQQRDVEESADKTLEEIIEHKMRLGGEHDTMLVSWQAKLPPDISVTDPLICAPEHLPTTAFLAIQYNQTLFSVHRNGLITNHKHLTELAARKFANEDYKVRLCNSSLVSYKIARSILTVLGQLQDRNCSSILVSTYTPLIAAVILAIYIHKRPTGIMVKLDLELLSAAITFIQRRTQDTSGLNQYPNLGKLLQTMHADLVTRVQKFESLPIETITSSGILPTAQDSIQGYDHRNSNHESLSQQPAHDSEPNNQLQSDLDLYFLADDVGQWPEILNIFDLPNDFGLN